MNDLHLHLYIIWLSAGISERKVGIKISWYATVTDYVVRRADDKRWHMIGFKVAGNQTHGLVTDRSQRN